MLTFNEYKDIVNTNLTSFIPETCQYNETISKAMKYSLEVGGKRLRPVLLLAACDFAGGDINEALPYACSLEYIHTYSLIHDDLPAMDNDDLRRGQPTNHKVFGEAMAILAGDGLLNTAAEVMTGTVAQHAKDPQKIANHAAAAYEIMRRAGINGMIGGQVADVENEHNEYTETSAELVNYIELHKTADLITCPVIAGLHIAGADAKMINDFTEYALNLGVAFQILDDILDFEGDADLLGKAVNKDAAIGKPSYVCVHGMDAAKSELHRVTEMAKSAIAGYGPAANFFLELADQMETRKS